MTVKWAIPKMKTIKKIITTIITVIAILKFPWVGWDMPDSGPIIAPTPSPLQPAFRLRLHVSEPLRLLVVESSKKCQAESNGEDHPQDSLLSCLWLTLHTCF